MSESANNTTGGEAMVWENELNERKKQILKSIIDDYILTAQPVGSRTIARKHELGLGSATIRNEMSDLEELGYISQPHTSAGRVPSDKGYRFYVDHLMQVHSLANEEMLRIRKAMDERIEELSDLIKRACNLVSSVTGYTTVVLTPQASRILIKSIQLVAVDERRILVVVVAGGSVVNNRLVKLENPYEVEELPAISNAINKLMSGKTINQITMPMLVELQSSLGSQCQLILPVMEAVQECVKRIESTDVFLDGITNILNYPEFSDLFRAREILELLKEEEVIAALVKSSIKKQHLDVRIGSENESDQMKDLSVVTAVYGREGTDFGTISVIGPTRMAYGKVVSSIQYMRELLNKEVIRIFGDEPY